MQVGMNSSPLNQFWFVIFIYISFRPCGHLPLCMDSGKGKHLGNTITANSVSIFYSDVNKGRAFYSQ